MVRVYSQCAEVGQLRQLARQAALQPQARKVPAEAHNHFSAACHTLAVPQRSHSCEGWTNKQRSRACFIDQAGEETHREMTPPFWSQDTPAQLLHGFPP